MVRNMLIFYGEGVLRPSSSSQPEDHPLSLVPAASSRYLQLPFVAGGRFLHPQPEDAPFRSDKGFT
jgi:hypothetical protein